jgi:hypothetical protein
MLFSVEFMKDVERWGWRSKAYAVLMDKLSPWLVLCRIITRPLVGTAADAASSPADLRFMTKPELIEFVNHLPDHMKDWRWNPIRTNSTNAGTHFSTEAWWLSPGARTSMCRSPMDCGPVLTPYRYGWRLYTLPEYRGRHDCYDRWPRVRQPRFPE